VDKRRADVRSKNYKQNNKKTHSFHVKKELKKRRKQQEKKKETEEIPLEFHCLQVGEFFLHFVLSAKSDTRTAQDERVPNPKKEEEEEEENDLGERQSRKECWPKT